MAELAVRQELEKVLTGLPGAIQEPRGNLAEVLEAETEQIGRAERWRGVFVHFEGLRRRDVDEETAGDELSDEKEQKAAALGPLPPLIPPSPHPEAC